MNVGFIGLGTIGGAIALNLQKAGYPMVVHDISPEAMQPLVDGGAKAAGSAAKVAEQSQFVLTSLPSHREVEAVALGPMASSPMLAARLFDLGPMTARFSQDPSVSLPSQEGITRLIVRPNEAPFDPAFTRPLLREVEQIVHNAGLEEKGLEVAWIGGPYRHAVEDVDTILGARSQL